jgi:signal transduction histidine kinase
VKRAVKDDGLDRLIAAEQDERRRIALFLHDGPVQNLAGIALMLDAAIHSVQTGKLDDAASILTTALERQRATIVTASRSAPIASPTIDGSTTTALRR